MIRQVGMVIFPEQIEHDRAGTKVERHAILDPEIRVTFQKMGQPPSLDIRNSDGRSRQRITDHVGITVELSLIQDGGEPIHMDDMVYFNLFRLLHNYL